jgi:hypothetical protein
MRDTKQPTNDAASAAHSSGEPRDAAGNEAFPHGARLVWSEAEGKLVLRVPKAVKQA